MSDSTSNNKRIAKNTLFLYFGAPDKPCGVVCADVNPKTVAKRYMIVQKVVSLHYESEWQ